MASQEQRVKLIEALSLEHRRLYLESADFHAFIDFLAEGLMVQVEGAAEAAALQKIRMAAAVRATEVGPPTHTHMIAGRQYQTGPPVE